MREVVREKGRNSERRTLKKNSLVSIVHYIIFKLVDAFVFWLCVHVDKVN